MKDIRTFVREYSEPDVARIRFAWNGRHGDMFVDQNYDFRKAVLAEALKEFEAAPVLLIRDLFEAETRYANEAWGVDRRVGDLARLLLTRGGPSFVEDFFRGKYRCQDAFFAAGSYPELARLLIDEINQRLAANPSEERRRLLEMAKEDCERW